MYLVFLSPSQTPDVSQFSLETEEEKALFVQISSTAEKVRKQGYLRNCFCKITFVSHFLIISFFLSSILNTASCCILPFVAYSHLPGVYGSVHVGQQTWWVGGWRGVQRWRRSDFVVWNKGPHFRLLLFWYWLCSSLTLPSRTMLQPKMTTPQFSRCTQTSSPRVTPTTSTTRPFPHRSRYDFWELIARSRDRDTNLRLPKSIRRLGDNSDIFREFIDKFCFLGGA